MGVMFSQKCDLCSVLQTEDNAAKIKGVAYSVNGVTKFSCAECKEMLDAAFTVGAEGLRDPLKALAKLTKERDALLRLLEQANMQKETGNASLVGIEFDHAAAQKFNDLKLDQRFIPAGQLSYRPEQTTKKLSYKTSEKAQDKKSKKK